MLNRLATLRAEDLMTSGSLIVWDSDPISQAIRHLKANDISQAPVMDKRTSKLVGMLVVRAQSWDMDDTRTVGDCMTTEFPSVGRTASLIDVARTMYVHYLDRVPILKDDGNLYGMITTRDVLAALAKAADES